MAISTVRMRQSVLVLLLTTFSLVAASAVTIDSVTVVNATCGNSDGSLEIFASGDGPFTYSADSGSTFQTDSSFQNLGPGTYYIYTEDALGELDSAVVSVYALGGVIIDSITTTDPSCFGDMDGLIHVHANAGTPPYMFSIDGGATFQTDSLFTGLPSGTYNIVVTDADTCSVFQTVTLIDPSPLTYTTTVTDANCPAADGLFDFTASGGDGNYQYSIDGGLTFQSNNVFLNLTAGGYDVMIQDGSGCSVSGTEFIGSQPGTGPNILTQNFINPLCNGSNNGSITVLATGPATIEYSVDGGSTFSTSGAFTGLSPGTYDVVIQDGNGCIQAIEFVLSEPAVLQTNITALDETCIGGNGSIDFSTTGGTQPYQFSIDSGTTFTSDSSFSNLSGGTYDYIVEDQNGCTSEGQIVLNSGGGPTIQSITTVGPSCPGEDDGSIVIDAIGNGNITYSINGGATTQPGNTFTGLMAGSYDIYLEDGDGCVTTQTVSLVEPSTPSADFSANPQTGVEPLTVNFTDLSTGAINYQWDFDDGNTSTSSDPSNTFSTGGTYLVMLVVDDGNCTDTAYTTINVADEPGMNIPNVFTPNDDDVNDVFTVETVGISELHAKIYNRWGEIVAEWRGPNGWWDGRTMPAGQLCPDGTYFYEIIAVGLDGETLTEAGTVTLLR